MYNVISATIQNVSDFKFDLSASLKPRPGSVVVEQQRPGSVVVEHSPGMREVGGSIPGHVKQKALVFEVLVLCLALSTKELETVWLARSQNNGLGCDITAYPWGGVSVG